MWQIGPVLELRDEHWDAICAHGLRAYPLEACGLLIGEWQGDRVIRFEPTPNAARSSRIYEVDGRDFLRVERVADDDGLAIIGVVHTHTHTDAYPSPTDIAAARPPAGDVQLWPRRWAGGRGACHRRRFSLSWRHCRLATRDIVGLERVGRGTIPTEVVGLVGIGPATAPIQ